MKYLIWNLSVIIKTLYYILHDKPQFILRRIKKIKWLSINIICSNTSMLMCIQITPTNTCIYTNKNEVNLNTKISTKTERISNVKCLQVRSYCHHSLTSYIQRMDLSLGQLLPAGWTTSLSCNGCFDTRLTKHMATHCRNQLSPTSLYLFFVIHTNWTANFLPWWSQRIIGIERFISCILKGQRKRQGLVRLRDFNDIILWIVQVNSVRLPSGPWTPPTCSRPCPWFCRFCSRKNDNACVIRGRTRQINEICIQICQINTGYILRLSIVII